MHKKLTIYSSKYVQVIGGVPVDGQAVQWRVDASGDWVLDFTKVTEWHRPETEPTPPVFELVSKLYAADEAIYRDNILSFATTIASLRGSSGNRTETFSDWKAFVGDVSEFLDVLQGINSKGTSTTLTQRIQPNLAGDYKFKFKFSKRITPRNVGLPRFRLTNENKLEPHPERHPIHVIASLVLVRFLNRNLTLHPTTLTIELEKGGKPVLTQTPSHSLEGMVWIELAAEMTRKHPSIEKCAECNGHITRQRSTKIFCSDRCRLKAHRNHSP